MKIAIALLCKTPNEIWLSFLNKFTLYDIYIVVDDNDVDYSEMYSDKYNKLKFIQIQEEVCEKSGFVDINFMIKYISSWDDTSSTKNR